MVAVPLFKVQYINLKIIFIFLKPSMPVEEFIEAHLDEIKNVFKKDRGQFIK